MNLGLAAESLRASRMRFTAELTPCSESTKVPSGHSSRAISSRVRSSPGRSRSMQRTWKGWALRRRRMPWRRSSPVETSASKAPKR